MTRPRIAVGGFQHETNTFSPLPATLADFERGGAWPALVEGPALIGTMRGINLPFAGFVERMRDEAELVPLLWAGAEPSGHVTAEAFDTISARLVEGIRAAGPLDAVYLDLHGAMVPEGFDDGEAELLDRIRAVTGPDLPIVVSLDLHGNMSPAFFERASLVTVYRTYPHVDMADTGRRAAELLRLRLAHGAPLARAYRQLDYIVPITAQSTMREPGRRLYHMLPTLEAEGVASVDLAIGFPPADIPDNGATIFAYGTDAGAVGRAADTLLTALRRAEPEFVNPLVPAAEAVAQALALAGTAQRPVVIADPQDNPGAGGTGDTTGLLRALIAAGASGAALSMLWDPAAAAQAHAAGQGAEIAVSLGGRNPAHGAPVECRAVVEHLSDGQIAFTGPMYGGAVGHLGPMATLRLVDPGAGIRVVVGTTRCQNADQALFRAMGIEPREQKILAVKSAVHFLGDYEPIAERVLFAEAPGDNPCRIETLPFTRLRPGLRLGPMGAPFGG